MKKPGLIAAMILLAVVVVSQNNKDIVFFDDFEDYNPGEQLACQNPEDWTTWNNDPCGPEDAYIADTYSFNGTNSVNIVENNDLVYELDEYLSAYTYCVSMMVYVPSGNSAYFNALSNFEIGTNPEWAFEVYFNNTGDGYLNAGGSYAATFNYNNDIWLYSELIIDFDSDHAYYYIDNNLIYDWQWTLGADGSGCQLQLAAVDFFGDAATTSFYFDDFKINQPYFCLPTPTNLTGIIDDNDVTLNWDAPSDDVICQIKPNLSKDLIGYNIYRNGDVIGTTEETTYTDYDLLPATYEYCITAIYDIGESECSNTFVLIGPLPLLPPTNFTGPSAVIYGEPFCFTWDAPGYGEWIHWDSGENTGNGIAAGSNFFVASHWMPSDIEAYQDFFLTKMSFFPVGTPDAVFTLKVWKGPNAENEVMSQDVQAFTVDSWNEVILSNPIIIEASTEYWFGYEVSYTTGFPAGCDDGPAIQGSGDMISIDGVDWVSMSEAYGLDYNWNLHAYLSYNGKAETFIPIVKQSSPKPDVGTTVPTLQNINLKPNKEVFTPKNNKDLLYYNLYRNGESLGNTDCDTLFSPGTYAYCVTAVYDEGESECSNEWIIDLWTNISQYSLNNIQIFPNPASGLVNIKSNIQINDVEVYNYAGQIIKNEKADGKFYQVNTSRFEPGIYFFRIETKDGVVSERIVVQ